MAKNATPLLLLGGLALGLVALAGGESKASPPPGGGPPLPPGQKPTLPAGAPPQLAACIDDNMSQVVVNKLATEAMIYMQTGQLPSGVSSTADWASQLEKAGYPKAAACVRSIPAGSGGLPNLPPGVQNPGGLGNATPGGLGGSPGLPPIPGSTEEAQKTVGDLLPSLVDVFNI